MIMVVVVTEYGEGVCLKNYWYDLSTQKEGKEEIVASYTEFIWTV